MSWPPSQGPVSGREGEREGERESERDRERESQMERGDGGVLVISAVNQSRLLYLL